MLNVTQLLNVIMHQKIASETKQFQQLTSMTCKSLRERERETEKNKMAAHSHHDYYLELGGEVDGSQNQLVCYKDNLSPIC